MEITQKLTCKNCHQDAAAKLVRHPSNVQRLIYWQCEECGANARPAGGHWASHAILATHGATYDDLPVGTTYKPDPQMTMGFIDW